MKNRIYKVISLLSAIMLTFSSFSVSAAAQRGSVQISTRIGEVLFGKRTEEKTLLVGGGIFGAKIKQSYVSIVEAKSAPRLHAGDILISLGGVQIGSIEDVEAVLRESDGSVLEAVARRGDNTVTAELTPSQHSGKYKLGIKLKDTSTGIGTVTFIDRESGIFGGLGHGVCDTPSGELVGLSSGSMTGVLLGGIHRGEPGKPGELCGVLTGKTTGTIYQNSECGIFGKIDESELDLSSCEELKIGKSDEVRTGAAEILATVKNGSPKRYSIEITELCGGDTPTKSFKLRVTDKTLIALSGGIVRGMSGSPIIQDGKLVGAVTHVMVADPTEGYGIFIENMLNAANNQSQQKAA